MIYIDYFSTINIINGIAKYTGGSNYANNIITELFNKNVEDLKLIVPTGIQATNLPIIAKMKVQIVETTSIQDVNYQNVRVLYLPQVNGTVLKQIKYIKKKYPQLLIYGTLHDRQHNCFKFDIYNLYYNNSLYSKMKSILEYYGKKVIFDCFYSDWVRYLDKVFTVSNYSLQHLKNKNVKYINYFIQDDFTSKVNKYTEQAFTKKEYCLMVGAGRPEKNALRTIEAFCNFHKKYRKSNLKMVLTGISEDRMYDFVRSGKWDKEIIDKYLIIKGYISYSELNTLYNQALYVVFTSKAEGFGLPALEAIQRGKPVLASYETSIPEVLGSAAYYVNPYDVNSIEEGFHLLSDKKLLLDLEKRINKRKEILDSQILLDKEVLLSEILS